jgi:hypothetical protein
VALADLDRAARELAKKLVPKLDAAAEERRERRVTEGARAVVDVDEDPAPESAAPTPAPVAPAPAAPAPATPAAATPAAAPKPRPKPTVDNRPALVVYQPDGEIAGGAIPVQGLASAALHRLVAKLGFRAVSTRGVGVAPTAVAADAARKQNARATIMLRVKDVQFSWAGVLTARGTVRVKLVGADGKVLLDRVVETDTLVGSRGDRHDALVRFVLRQALEIVTRDVARALR